MTRRSYLATLSVSATDRHRVAESRFLAGTGETGSYGQFCPVAMAAEIICSRWTVLILREMLCGTRRFNDLRRGVPRMSPTLLSKRLRELLEAGVISIAPGSGGVMEYHLTKAGE